MADTVPEPERKMAPVQGWPQGIPWSLHLEAYAAYCKKWSPQKALIEGWCRGGFHVDELDEFIPGWRERASEIASLRTQLEQSAADNAALREIISTHARIALEQDARVKVLEDALRAILNEQDAQQGYASAETYDAARAALEVPHG